MRSDARHKRMDLSWLPEAIIASFGLTASVLMSLSCALTPWVITSLNKDEDLPDPSLINEADDAAVVVEEEDEMMLLFGIVIAETPVASSVVDI